MKKVFIVAFFVLLAYPFNLMFGGSDIIQWSDVKQLTWKDFKKDNGKSPKPKLKSSIGIVIEPEQKDDNTMIANVYAEFNKENSSKPNSEGQTDEALHHEQLRFDLAEMYARKERKQLPDSAYKTVGKFYIIAQHINKQINKDFLTESAKYDEETKNGSDATAQEKWDKDVSDRLGQLSSYTSDDKVELNIEKAIPKK